MRTSPPVAASYSVLNEKHDLDKCVHGADSSVHGVVKFGSDVDSRVVVDD
jgi:hypothetical protein